MRFGFYLPVRGAKAAPAAMSRLLAAAESLGFDSVVVPDHIVQPVRIDSKYPYTIDGSFYSGPDADSLEQHATMAFVAAKTRWLRIISSVMVVPHRNPVVAAKSLATIDVLSEGRLTVGVGVGWEQEEFRALRAAPFEKRGAATDEYLRIFKTLWTQAPASFAGEYYSFDELWCLPQPTQKPHPPIWIGGESQAALRRAARLGDGWHPVGANPKTPLGPAEMRVKLAELFRLTEAEGRDPKSLTISYKSPLYDTSLTAAGDPRPFFGPPAKIQQDIGEYADLGVSEIILDFRAAGLDQSIERMQGFAALAGMKPRL